MPAPGSGHTHEARAAQGAQVTNFVHARSRILNGEASEIGGGRGRGFWNGCAAGGEKWSRGMQMGYAAANGGGGVGDRTLGISMANRDNISSGSTRWREHVVR